MARARIHLLSVIAMSADMPLTTYPYRHCDVVICDVGNYALIGPLTLSRALPLSRMQDRVPRVWNVFALLISTPLVLIKRGKDAHYHENTFSENRG